MKKIAIILALFLVYLSLFSNGVSVVDGVNGEFLELKSCSINTNITNQVSETKTELLFKNSNNATASTVFSFPLLEQASATNLRWFINDTWHEAVIAPGEQDSLPGNPGDDMYPYLEAHLGKTPLNFGIPDDVAAGDSLIIELTFVQLLDYQFGEVSYFYPADYQLIQEAPLDSFSLHMNIVSERVIEELNLSTFTDYVQNNEGNTATLDLNLYDTAVFDNIEITYSLSEVTESAISMSSLLSSEDVPDSHGDGFFLTLLEPDPATSQNVINKVFTLILDRSGSMEGTKITQAKNAASFIIENMNEGDMFNIVDFSSNVRALSSSHLPFNIENEALALNYVNHIFAEGATNISGAFELAIPQFASASDSTANIIIFLTDGEATSGITNTDELVSYTGNLVDETETSINLFTFGIGPTVNAQLLTLLATNNGGYAEFLGSGELESVLTDFYLKIRNPVLLSPSINFVADDVSEVYPEPLPNLYLGQQMLISGRYQQSTTVETQLDGFAFGQPVSYNYELEFSDSTNVENQFLTKIWANLKIEHLLIQYYSLDPNSYQAEQIRDEIIQISIDYGVICEFTSFSNETDSEDITVEENVSPVFEIVGNYPNPFNPNTCIKFAVNNDIEKIILVNIYNSKGQLIKRIACEVNGKGIYSVNWDGRDRNEVSVASGIYFYSIDFGNMVRNAKMVLLK